MSSSDLRCEMGRLFLLVARSFMIGSGFIMFYFAADCLSQTDIVIPWAYANATITLGYSVLATVLLIKFRQPFTGFKSIGGGLLFFDVLVCLTLMATGARLLSLYSNEKAEVQKVIDASPKHVDPGPWILRAGWFGVAIGLVHLGFAVGEISCILRDKTDAEEEREMDEWRHA